MGSQRVEHDSATFTFIFRGFEGFPGGSVVKKLPANAGDSSSAPGLGRSLRKGNDNLLQYSCLGNPMDRRSLADPEVYAMGS